MTTALAIMLIVACAVIVTLNALVHIAECLGAKLP